jgi:hypothetical protein
VKSFHYVFYLFTAFIQTDNELRYMVDGVPLQVSMAYITHRQGVDLQSNMSNDLVTKPAHDS